MCRLTFDVKQQDPKVLKYGSVSLKKARGIKLKNDVYLVILITGKLFIFKVYFNFLLHLTALVHLWDIHLILESPTYLLWNFIDVPRKVEKVNYMEGFLVALFSFSLPTYNKKKLWICWHKSLKYEDESRYIQYWKTSTFNLKCSFLIGDRTETLLGNMCVLLRHSWEPIYVYNSIVWLSLQFKD